MNFFTNLLQLKEERVLDFADFTSEDIGSFNLLENANFVPFSYWTGKEGEFRTKPLGATYKKYASLSGTHKDIPLSFFIAEKHIRNRNSSSYEYEFFIDVEIPFYTTHLIVVPHSGASATSISASNGVNVELGKFNEYYNILTAKGQEAKAFEMLPPDTLLHMMERIPNSIIHYHKNVIRIQFTIEATPLNLQKNLLPLITKESFIKNFNTVIESVVEIVDSAYAGRIEPQEFVEVKGFSNKFEKLTYLYAIAFFTVWCTLFFFGDKVDTSTAFLLFFGLVGFFFIVSAFAGFAAIKALTRNIRMSQDGLGRKDGN
jgi:hypothetical protein